MGTAAAAPAKPEQTKALTIVDRVEQSRAIALLEEKAPALRQMLSDDDAVARFNRGVVIAMTKNPDLLSATPESILMACFEAAQQGLEPTGAAGGAHLVPYKVNGVKVAQLIPDYRGVIRLITRDGTVTSVQADVVKEGDEFSYQLGSEPWVSHTPALDGERSQRATTHAYAVFRIRGEATPKIVVEDRAGIERVRKRGANASASPWNTDWDEMAKKTMVKRGSKLCPVGPEIRRILIREDELAGDQDDVPAGAIAEPRGTRAQQLGARLTRNVTPSADDAADDQQPAGLTPEKLAAELERLNVSRAYAIEESKKLFPREANVPLTDEQRAELVAHLAAQEPESQAL